MTNKLAKAGTGTTLFVVAGLVVLALGMTGTGALDSKNDAWAVIFATPEGGNNGPMNEGWALHNWLLDHGWLNSHIKFLADHEGADAAPTKENLHSAISDIAAGSNSRSLVFISVMDHGEIVNSDVYFDSSSGPVSSGNLGSWVNEIASFKTMVVEVSFRFSGGFLPSLSGPNRLIISSHTSAQGYSPNHFLLSEGLSSTLADTNGDGYVSVQEAFVFECHKIWVQYPNTQTPQISDNTGPVRLAVA